MPPEKHQGDFGARLREARETRSLSLRVIADSTRISVRALEALEKNDIRRLPGGIFSRAFVRAYAVEVGLDPEQTVAEFMTRFPDEIVTQGHPRTRAIVDELERDARGGRRWPLPVWLALVGVPLIGLLIYFGVIGRRALPPVQTTAPASAQGVAAASTPPARFSITVHARRATTVSVSLDGRAAFDLGLDAGATRAFDASGELLIMPVDPSALEWSAEGVTPRVMTGPLTLTPRTIQTLSGLP